MPRIMPKPKSELATRLMDSTLVGVVCGPYGALLERATIKAHGKEYNIEGTIIDGDSYIRVSEGAKSPKIKGGQKAQKFIGAMITDVVDGPYDSLLYMHIIPMESRPVDIGSVINGGQCYLRIEG